jgi:DegV family protein with EDD domain
MMQFSKMMRMNATVSIAYLDGPRLSRALSAGIRHLFLRRDYINRINVFPVPDGDTGTNMAFTFKSIMDALGGRTDLDLDQVVERITEGALDGARGNSGAIMAQFFQGFREALGQNQLLTAAGLARASVRGAEQAWTAMAEPVAGTLPTVLEDFGAELTRRVDDGIRDIRELLRSGLEAARESLANTPNQLPVLKQAGVVDAGGQGFVDLLEGIWAFIDRGVIDELEGELSELASVEVEVVPETGGHRFCTECVIEGPALDRNEVMRRLQEIDSSSLMVAGSTKRVRVHIHVNNPAEVFLACEDFGDITQQKADDMSRQHGLLNQVGRVAVVVDSGADLPDSEVERLGIHVVPVRLSFGEREYLDGVSIQPAEFYRMLESGGELPRTSQPPARDFRRVYALLASHGYEVISVGLTSKLSGTTQAARSAAERTPNASIRVVDSLNASSGQGLLAIVAAEAAEQGMSMEEIESLLLELVPQTQTIAFPDDLAAAVRGGRVPAWLKNVTDFLHVMPVLRARKGKLSLAGLSPGRGANARALARRVLRRMNKDTVYRVMIAHADNLKGAHEVRRMILEGHPMVHSCHLAYAGPALGVHLGLGGLIVGFLPQPGFLS